MNATLPKDGLPPAPETSSVEPAPTKRRRVSRSGPVTVVYVQPETTAAPAAADADEAQPAAEASGLPFATSGAGYAEVRSLLDEMDRVVENLDRGQALLARLRQFSFA